MVIFCRQHCRLSICCYIGWIDKYSICQFNQYNNKYWDGSAVYSTPKKMIIIALFLKKKATTLWSLAGTVHSCGPWYGPCRESQIYLQGMKCLPIIKSTYHMNCPDEGIIMSGDVLSNKTYACFQDSVVEKVGERFVWNTTCNQGRDQCQGHMLWIFLGYLSSSIISNGVLHQYTQYFCLWLKSSLPLQSHGTQVPR